MPDEAEISAKLIAVNKDIFNSKIVRSKNSKDRECQEITEDQIFDSQVYRKGILQIPCRILAEFYKVLQIKVIP